MLRTRLAEFQLALMLLTRLPAGRIIRQPLPGMGTTVWAWPLIGAAVGALAAGVMMLGMALGAPVQVAVICALTTQVLITGAMHEDGLADFIDGIGGRATPAERLDIMRSGSVGAFGVTALLLVFLVEISAVTAIVDQSRSVVWPFVMTASVSRAAMTVPLIALPPAQTDGLGHAAGSHMPTGAIVMAATTPLLLSGWGGLPALVCAAILSVAITRLAARRLGGQTGDVCGAVQRLSAPAIWVILAVAADT